MTTSPDKPWKLVRNIRSHPPMTEMTTSTIATHSVTASSETHAMRRLRRYLKMRSSLYKASSFDRLARPWAHRLAVGCES